MSAVVFMVGQHYFNARVSVFQIPSVDLHFSIVHKNDVIVSY